MNKKSIFFLVIFMLIFILLNHFAVSGGGGNGGAAPPPPPPTEICGDWVDNDGDFLVDCDDPDCADYVICSYPDFLLFDQGYSYILDYESSIESDLNDAICKNLLAGQPNVWLYDQIGTLMPLGITQPTESICCGDDGAFDNGIFAYNINFPNTDGSYKNNYVCANDGSGWQWRRADANKLNIIEINKPLQNAIISYDVVSDSHEWFRCDPGSVGEAPLKISTYASDFSRFYCYYEDDKASFIQCCGDSPNFNPLNPSSCVFSSSDLNPSINPFPNKRALGSISTMILESETKSFSKTSSLVINIDDLDLRFTDWSRYESLDIFMILSNITAPVRLKITASAPYLTTVFHDNIMDYVVGTPVNNERIHISIPIDDWRNIYELTFETDPSFFLPDSYNYNAEIEKIFLIPKDISNLAYCSDRRFDISKGITNMWVRDIDNNSAACNANYEWTGTNCCGDDNLEYYNDTNSGCWNGEVIEDDSAAANVKFAVTKIPESKYQQTYPDQSFTTTVARAVPSVFGYPYGWVPSADASSTYNDIYCPAGYAACGAKNTVANYRLGQLACCPLQGFTASFAGTYFASGGSGDGQGFYCNPNYVVCGARPGIYFGTYSSGLSGYFSGFICCPLSGAFTVSGPRFKDNAGVWDGCAANELVCGGITHRGNDIDEMFCCGVSPGTGQQFTSNVNAAQEKRNIGLIPAAVQTPYAATYSVSSDNPDVNVFFAKTGDASTDFREDRIYAVTGYTESTEIHSTDSVTSNFSYTYRDEKCIYPIVFGEGNTVEIENLYPAEYNLFIVEPIGGNKMLAAPTASTSEKGAYILVENIKKNLMFYNGEFYGCKAPNYILEDTPDLIDNSADYCDVKGTHFCSYNNEWSNEAGGAPSSSLRNNTKQVPAGISLTNISEFGCCPADYCWNGTRCLGDMSRDPDAMVEIEDTLYSCIEGEWLIAIEKLTWDYQDKGVCPSPTQCLVDKSGNPDNNNDPSDYLGSGWSGNPICIETGQFIEDHYCDDGNWTSRTKLIAMQLLNISGETGSFALYCDEFYKVLPSYGDTSTRDKLIEGKEMTPFDFACFDSAAEWNDKNNYDFPCANNFCSLTYNVAGDGSNIVLTTSVNRQPDFKLDNDFFLKAVFGITDQTYCNHLFNESGINFTECNPNDNTEFWYSNGLNSVISSYLQQLDGLKPPATWDKVVNFFRNIFNFFLGKPPVDEFIYTIDFSIINQTKTFNKICIAKQGDTKAYLVMDDSDPDKTFLVAEYDDISTDMCAIMNALEISYNLIGSNIYYVCNQTEAGDSKGDYKIYAETPDYVPGHKFGDLWDSLVDTCIGLS